MNLWGANLIFSRVKSAKSIDCCEVRSVGSTRNTIKLTSTMPYYLLALVIVLSCTSVRGQECPGIQESELGSTTTPGTSGLIADAITLGDPGSAPDILVLDSQTVCFAAAATRDQYRYASVVVSFNCSGSLAPGNALGISTCDGELTVQFDFECVAGPQWQRALTLGGDNVFNPADGNLTTSLKTDCSFCVDPAIAGSLGTKLFLSPYRL